MGLGEDHQRELEGRENERGPGGGTWRGPLVGVMVK